MDQASLDNIIHVIQVALTPIFLLTGLANLLSVFSTRLGRVADRVDLMSARLEEAKGEAADRIAAQLTYLRKRSLVLDAAVILGTIAGGGRSGRSPRCPQALPRTPGGAPPPPRRHLLSAFTLRCGGGGRPPRPGGVWREFRYGSWGVPCP